MSIAEDVNKTAGVQIDVGRHLLAGGVAGAVSRTVTAPLDRIKINLMVTPLHYRLVPFVTEMYKEGGVKAFWRGNFVNIIKIAPESAIKFSTNEMCKDYLVGDSNQQPRIVDRFMAGATAGSFAQTAVYPLEVLKTRLALARTGEFHGIIYALKKIYSGGGMKAFYRGYAANLLGNVPYAGIELTVYEGLRQHTREIGMQTPPTILQSIFYGVVATMGGQLVTYPLSLIKTRLVAQDSLHFEEETLSMTQVFRRVLRRHGFMGLYRGFGVNAMKVCPAVSITYAVLELMRRMMGITSS